MKKRKRKSKENTITEFENSLKALFSLYKEEVENALKQIEKEQKEKENDTQNNN